MEGGSLTVSPSNDKPDLKFKWIPEEIRKCGKNKFFPKISEISKIYQNNISLFLILLDREY